MKLINVLIADDHQMFREGLESLMKLKIPCISKIFQAKNGKEVLEILNKESVDIIFMDIHMPVKDGIQTTREVMQLYPDIKIITVTMMSDRNDIVNMFKSGACGYILKNTSFNEIETAIQLVMNGEKYY